MTHRIMAVTPGGKVFGGGTRNRIVPALEGLGAVVEARTEGDFDPACEQGWIFLQGTAGWYPRTVSRLAQLDPARRPPVLLWITEPLPPSPGSGLRSSRLSARDVAKRVLRDQRTNDQRANLRRTLALVRDVPEALVVATTRQKQETLAACGVEVPAVPMGVSVNGAGAVPDTGEGRDIDVLFIGDLNVPHRRRALRRLRRAGVDVAARGAWSDAHGLFGEERDEMLRRTKLLLNLSRHPGNCAHGRLGLGAASGAVVVSEPMVGTDPWVPGVHYEEAPLDELPALIADLLHDGARRQGLAAAAHALAREHTAEESARLLLRLMDDRSSRAPVAESKVVGASRDRVRG